MKVDKQEIIKKKKKTYEISLKSNLHRGDISKK